MSIGELFRTTARSDVALAEAPSLRLVVLSDLRLLREGVRLLLGPSVCTIRVVGTADLTAAPQQIAEWAPDAILIDATSPGGLVAAQSIHDALPHARTIAFGLAEAEAEPVVLACARAGMAGFVAPDATVDELIATVRSAVRGELVCSPRTAGMLLHQLGAIAADPDRQDGVSNRTPLTQREREVAVMVSDGLSNKQIARMLGIQCATVKNHVHNVLEKLRLSRRGEVAAQLRRGRPRGGLLHVIQSGAAAEPSRALA